MGGERAMHQQPRMFVQSLPSTPAHIAEAKFANSPHRKAWGGKDWQRSGHGVRTHERSKNSANAFTVSRFASSLPTVMRNAFGR